VLALKVSEAKLILLDASLQSRKLAVKPRRGLARDLYARLGKRGDRRCAQRHPRSGLVLIGRYKTVEQA
jgi:hypothetical protein